MDKELQNIFLWGELNLCWSEGIDMWLHPQFNVDIATYPCHKFNVGLAILCQYLEAQYLNFSAFCGIGILMCGSRIL